VYPLWVKLAEKKVLPLVAALVVALVAVLVAALCSLMSLSQPRLAQSCARPLHTFQHPGSAPARL
jgi:CHASE1-domain containing sensor protein